MPPASTGPGSCDVGLVGLAVMGQNLALNMADHGFKVAVYNRTAKTMADFVTAHPKGSFGSLGGGLFGEAALADFVNAIKRPRKIVIMVKAGEPTDAVINGLTPLLSPSDIVIDGGNAFWEDTIRRERALKAQGFRFVGSGVSGGEEGARYGPSLMPGGDKSSWEEIKPIWTAIAAKVDPKTGKPIMGGSPGKPVQAPGAESCAAYIGPDGAGHYVKMVHNGIEYGDMQMICEAYHLLREVGALPAEQMSAVFAEWNKGDLDSFLVEITADVLKQRDPVTGKPFVDMVLDAAGQKGTGKWTSISALDMAVPAATVAEAVFARCMSAVKDERVAASKLLKGPSERFTLTAEAEKRKFVDAVRNALYCSKICSYAQGFQLLAAAGKQYKWTFDYGTLAMIWRGGCIIRARFLQKIKEAYDRNPALANLLLDPFFTGVIAKAQADWRWVVATAAKAGVPVPAFSSALSYYDSYRCASLPANLLQAQRDYFGAHTYERIDQPRGKMFHLDWVDPKRPQLEIQLLPPSSTPRTGAANPSREGLGAIFPASPVNVPPPGCVRTARMLLRPLGPGDREGYIDAVLRSREDLRARMPMHKEGESDDQMFDRQLAIVSAEQAAGQCFRCIAILDSGEVAGGFNLNAISRGLEWQADITWWVATPLSGRGLATEGVAALVEQALADLPSGLGLHQVHAWITRDNLASIRVAEKAGLVRRSETQSYLNTGASWAIHDKYTRTI